MGPTNSTAFSRTLAFTRSHVRNGFFSWPTITFTLKESEDGPEIGKLRINYRKAFFTTADTNEAFNVQKSVWMRRWFYISDDEREFGRIGFGWNFLPSFTFADGSRYYLRAKRRWPFRRSKPGKPLQSASFMRDDMEVMLLQSFTPLGFFTNEMTAPMAGNIGTNVAELHVIAGLLLFYQGNIETRNRAAH